MADVIVVPGYDDTNNTRKNVNVQINGGALSTALPSSVGTDRSITATTTSAQLLAANATRRRFYVKNDSTIDVWINPGAAAVATAGAGNIRVPANGGYFEFGFSTSAWNIIAASTTAAITSREF